jgi:ABC-type lipoprotein release transport system permease subunit
MKLERHKKILEYTLSSLLRRRYKNSAIIAVFSVVIAVLSSILFLTHSFKREALEVLDSAPELIVQKISGGRHDLVPLEYMERIREIPGVGSVVPRYWGYYYDTITDGNYTVIAVDETLKDLEMLEGRMPERGGECVIGKGVADVRFAKIGGEVFFTDNAGKTLALRIVGIFRADSSMLTNDLVLVRKEDLLRLFGMSPERATDIVVQVYNESEVPTVARKIKTMMPDSRPIMKEEIIRTYETVFSWRSGMILTMFLGALIAFCILAWDKATGLSADERREIGILKAIGWETSDIIELKFWEGMVISFTSFLTGMIMAYVHVFFTGASLITPALKGWSVVFPAFRLMPQIDVYQVFSLLFLSVVPYVASTIIPAWKAAITDPDIVMRG